MKGRVNIVKRTSVAHRSQTNKEKSARINWHFISVQCLTDVLNTHDKLSFSTPIFTFQSTDFQTYDIVLFCDSFIFSNFDKIYFKAQKRFVCIRNSLIYF